MGFGEELWDKWDDVMKLSDDHIKEMTHMREYLKEYTKLESKFSSDLKALITKYQKPQKHSLDTFDQIFDATSLGKAWAFLLTKTLVIAAQHDEISREINDGPVNQLKEVVKAQEKEKKMYYTAGQAKINVQRKTVRVMQNARDEYLNASKHAESQRQQAQAYDQAPNKTPEKVKQWQVNIQKAEKKVAQVKVKYEEQINILNKFNANYHTRDMPQIFQQVEVAMSGRIDTMKQVIVDVAESQTSKNPVLLECMESIKSNGQSVSEAEDLVGVCSMMQTGPMDYEVVFEEFDPSGRGRKKVTGSKSSNSVLSGNGMSKKNSVNYDKLPSAERSAAISKRLAEINAALAKNGQTRSGVETLVKQYRETPSFGDVAEAEKQLAEITRQAQELRHEKAALSSCLSSPSLSPAQPAPPGSERSVPPGWVEATDPEGIKYYYREEGGPSQYEHPGYDAAQATSSGAPSMAGTEEPEADDFAENETGEGQISEGSMVKAMYSFTDDGDGLLQMTQGEKLEVVGNAGDGWVHVKNASGSEGYVPEGYLCT